MTATDSATLSASASRKAQSVEAACVLSSIIETLTPAKKGGSASSLERKNARILLVIAYAAIAQGEPSPMAALSVKMSDGSALPFKIWCARTLNVDTTGKAYAVACA